MTDRQVYEHAQAELSRCEQRLEELRTFLRVYEEVASLSGKAASTQRAPVRAVPSRACEQAIEPMQEWERMADAAIRREGHPLRVREIYEAIVPMGFHIDSKDPVNALTTKLVRSRHFTRPSRGLFMVAEKAETSVRETADYDAEDAPEHNERTLSVEPPSDLIDRLP